MRMKALGQKSWKPATLPISRILFWGTLVLLHFFVVYGREKFSENTSRVSE